MYLFIETVVFILLSLSLAGPLPEEDWNLFSSLAQIPSNEANIFAETPSDNNDIKLASANSLDLTTEEQSLFPTVPQEGSPELLDQPFLESNCETTIPNNDDSSTYGKPRKREALCFRKDAPPSSQLFKFPNIFKSNPPLQELDRTPVTIDPPRDGEKCKLPYNINLCCNWGPSYEGYGIPNIAVYDLLGGCWRSMSPLSPLQ